MRRTVSTLGLSGLFPEEKKRNQILQIQKVMPTIMREPQFNVMLDLSILLSPQKMKILNSIHCRDSRISYYISTHFYEYLKNQVQLISHKKTHSINKENVEYIDDQWKALLKFYGIRKNISKNKIFETIDEYLAKQFVTINDYSMSDSQEKYASFYANFAFKNEPLLIQYILFEEWAFIQSHSFLSASSKKTMNAFKKCGAIALDFSKEALEITKKKIQGNIRKKLHKNIENPITVTDTLRYFGKYVAIGGSSASVYFSTDVEFGIVFGTGVFLFLDPDITE